MRPCVQYIDEMCLKSVCCGRILPVRHRRFHTVGLKNSENVKKASCRAYKLMFYVSNVPDKSSIRATFP